MSAKQPIPPQTDQVKPEPPPVFPRPRREAIPGWMPKVDESGDGMTLRDYFAGQALAMGEAIWPGGSLHRFGGADPQQTAAGVAAACYLIADAMLEARKR